MVWKNAQENHFMRLGILLWYTTKPFPVPNHRSVLFCTPEDSLMYQTILFYVIPKEYVFLSAKQD
jgi:hypothetical protein